MTAGKSRTVLPCTGSSGSAFAGSQTEGVEVPSTSLPSEEPETFGRSPALHFMAPNEVLPLLSPQQAPEQA